MDDPTRPSIEDATGTVNEANPVTVRARVGGPSPVTSRTIAVLGAVLVILIVKPWGAGEVTSAIQQSPRESLVAPSTGPAANPTAAPRSQAEVIADQCRAPSGWRILTVARWHDETVHIWSAVEPVATADPADPQIPYVSMVADQIPALGYCAPLFGPDRPVGGATAALWRIAANGTAESLHPARIEPPFETALVGLYAPPPAIRPDQPASWPSGRYLFNAAGRWFGIDLVIAPSAGRPAASIGS